MGKGAVFRSAAAGACLFAVLPAAAQTSGSPFTVAKVSVDVTSKSAVDAKAKAMAEAGQKGLAILLRRIAPFGALAYLPDLGPAQAEALVEGLSIRSERMSTTRYIASFDISFNEQGVKQMLADHNIPLNEARAPSILVLPLVLDGDKVKSASESWQAAWLDLDAAHGLAPATVVQPRQGLDASTVRAALAGNGSAYQRIKSGYTDQPLVIAVGQPAEGKFVTRLVGTDSVGRINYGRSAKLKKDGKVTEREEAEFALALLESRWKAMQGQGAAMGAAPAAYGQEGAPSAAAPAPQGEPGRIVMALVEFSGLKQWQDIRARLMYVPGLQALEVNSLSARGASVTFDYAGSLSHLQQVLAENGFSFENADESFIIRPR
jgi:hypothetical protein